MKKEKTIENEIYTFINKERKKIDDKELRFPLSPSTIMGCRKKLVMSLINYYFPNKFKKSTIFDRSTLTFKHGDAVEKLLRDILIKRQQELKRLKKRKIDFELNNIQKKVEIGGIGGHLFGGSIDGTIKIDNIIYLLDFKSINTRGFKEIPKIENLAQIQLYLHSKWAKKLNIENGMLLYLNKDTAELKSHTFKYDPVLALKLVKRAHLIWRFFVTWLKDNKNFPECDFKSYEWQCKYCPFSKHCHKK